VRYLKISQSRCNNGCLQQEHSSMPTEYGAAVQFCSVLQAVEFPLGISHVSNTGISAPTLDSFCSSGPTRMLCCAALFYAVRQAVETILISQTAAMEAMH
jgi:hypothetical protein